MNRSLLLFLLALSLLSVLPACDVGDDDDDTSDDDDSTPDPADTDDDGDGLSENEGDCDDSDAAISPNESEATCDGVDNDCDQGTPDDIDGDADGVLCSTDCDDADPANFPGNTEICDGADNDCDGTSWVTGEETDDDGDGALACVDCDDSDGANYPGNAELCDGADNDCNGFDDMGNPGVAGEEADDDGDGQSECQGDCDDAEAMTYPEAPELCDGADNDCNGLDDMGNPGVAGEEADDDGDGQSECQGDCDDSDAMTYPGAPEGLLGSDRDCDGVPGGSGSLSLADASFVGENAYDNSGSSVASAGDVDGDGLDDLLIGVAWNDDGGSNAGKTYLFFGSTVAAGGPFNLSLADAFFVGPGGDRSGVSVASAGDVDGDGLDDLLIGAYWNDDGGSDAGKTYLFFGSTVASGGSFDLSLADASFVGENADDHSGVSVASAGDVDGDGLVDLLIGAYCND
ncbi:MAG: hypothetical protein GY898_16250, partial [Proteobacteria bacterium]|nr:hypothetical protein [Pseudomonadota bacterium]